MRQAIKHVGIEGGSGTVSGADADDLVFFSSSVAVHGQRVRSEPDGTYQAHGLLTNILPFCDVLPYNLTRFHVLYIADTAGLQ
jgi:hypothetical protein